MLTSFMRNMHVQRIIQLAAKLGQQVSNSTFAIPLSTNRECSLAVMIRLQQQTNDLEALADTPRQRKARNR